MHSVNSSLESLNCYNSDILSKKIKSDKLVSHYVQFATNQDEGDPPKFKTYLKKYVKGQNNNKSSDQTSNKNGDGSNGSNDDMLDNYEDKENINPDKIGPVKMKLLDLKLGQDEFIAEKISVENIDRNRNQEIIECYELGEIEGKLGKEQNVDQNTVKLYPVNKDSYLEGLIKYDDQPISKIYKIDKSTPVEFIREYREVLDRSRAPCVPSSL